MTTKRVRQSARERHNKPVLDKIRKELAERDRKVKRCPLCFVLEEALRACGDAASPLVWDKRWAIFLTHMPVDVAREIVIMRARLQDALAQPQVAKLLEEP